MASISFLIKNKLLVLTRSYRLFQDCASLLQLNCFIVSWAGKAWWFASIHRSTFLPDTSLSTGSHRTKKKARELSSASTPQSCSKSHKIKQPVCNCLLQKAHRFFLKTSVSKYYFKFIFKIKKRKKNYYL